MSALEVQGLVGGYGEMVVTRGVDLQVDSGEVVALLGPNGAGKTTILSTIAGVLPALGGSITVLGHDATVTPVSQLARAGLGYVPEDRGLFHQLTVGENMKLRRRGESGSETDVFQYFPALKSLTRRRTGLLSGGEQQMLAIACALLGSPKVLLVDEMSLGLAPTLVQQLLPIIRDIARASKIAVLVVEQHVHAALRVADRAYVLSRGEVVLSGPASEVSRKSKLVKASYMGEAALS